MSFQNDKSVQVWIGLVHVKPKLNKAYLLDGAIGAFFSGLVLAKTKEDYFIKLTKFLEENELGDLDIVEIDELELFKEYEKKYTVPKEVRRLVANLGKEAPVMVTTFDTYEHE